MSQTPLVDEIRLRRFARLANRMLQGTAAQGVGTRAAHNRAGPGLEFLDVRQYSPGDDLRHVDWRQSSRRRQPMVRRYRDESASDWFLCIDGSASMGINGKWQLVVELAIALSYALIYGGHRVGIATFAERIHNFCPLGRGQRQFAKIIRELNSYQPPPRGGASRPGLCAQSVSRSGNLIVLSDFLRDDAMSDDIRRLRAAASSARAIQIMGEADVRLDASGPIQLYDIENGSERRLTMSPASQKAANDALQEHQRRLRRLFATLGMPFSSCETGDDWEKVLATHLGV